MLEILAVYYLCKKIGEVLREKGRNPLGYQVMTVIFWLGGEFFGAFAGAIFDMAVLGKDEPGGLVYLFAIIGAVCGAGAAWLIAKTVSPLNEPYATDTSSQAISCRSCGEQIKYQTGQCPVCGESLEFTPTF